MLATIAVIIAVAIGAGARAQELSCPLGYAPNQNNTSCVPSQPSAGPAQGGVAGQAQQLFNSFGAAVQGAPSKAAGALGGMLNSFGMGGSGAAPQGYNGGAAQGGVGGTATNDSGDLHPAGKIAAHGACALLTANDVAEVLGESVNWRNGTPDACKYSTTESTDVDLNLAGGRAEFDKVPGEVPGVTPLSGVGDAAFLNPPGRTVSGAVDWGAGAEVYVIKRGTYFYLTVQSDSNNADDPRKATALARKVADRIK